ncbi:hypothetical protein I3843_02G005700 [Carya illinoinensis]|uniref:Uncharacterized protein n=1 Tax=Carya illinoinensis TaxID=32201 RepID=A0A922FMA9_CARIL|nr:hypothetical protein I3760_02G010100 [Carya illinoinensis]KAG6724966.1 hypothetical protein I3842_02G010300 [Carya illinoinensis]KAG7990026.1 hypothetical protein I3843_02G005700 [Carya illinoinensis]
MPLSKFNGACATFLLVLILCHEILCVEGRHSKSEEYYCKKCSMHDENSTSTAAKDINDDRHDDQLEQTSKVEYVDDFRPTEPGHSPGVGHSIHN